MVRLAENLEPIALIGAGGIGKSSIALTVLHHDRVKQRFGENRRFIRCDKFPASPTHFLSRLSEVIGAGIKNPKNLSPLRPLLSSKEMFIVLDNAESILDPKETGAKEIYSVVDELCRFETICLCITSRITTVPPRCRHPEIHTLSMEAACDIFYDVYNAGGRSNIINDLLRRLDFHALSITLLATAASHNGWDHNRLAKEWDAQRAQILQTDYNDSLAATIELSLSSPTFLSLGPIARDLLGVVAFFPQGIDENNLDWLFPSIPNRRNIFDKFCALSLAYRSNGFITMLAPVREYICPQDPRSSPLLCMARDRYFTRLSVDVYPGKPGFEEARWIVLEDVNVEHLLDVFTSIHQTRDDVWEACCHFVQHLVWHKPRQTVLRSKIEALADEHPTKPQCSFQLSRLFGQVGNNAEKKLLLAHSLELERQRGEEIQAARILQQLSDVNRHLSLPEEGIRQAKEALDICKRAGDAREKVESLYFLAWAFYGDKQLDAAEDAASCAIDLVPESGLEYLVCRLQRVLGYIYQSKGEDEKAIHYLKRALKTVSPFNWRYELFWNHYALADVLYGKGEFDDANAQVKQAKSHAADDPYLRGFAMHLQAAVWQRRGRLEEAKSEALHSLEIFEKLGATDGVEVCRRFLQGIE